MCYNSLVDTPPQLSTDPFAVAVNPQTNVVFVTLRAGNALVKFDDTFGN